MTSEVSLCFGYNGAGQSVCDFLDLDKVGVMVCSNGVGV